MAPALLNTIGDMLPQLRKSEQKVAQAVLADPDRAMRSSIAELAAEANVSEPTVMRFCATIGCGGFQGFKLLLAQSLALGIPATQSTITTGDTTKEIIEKVFDYSVTSLDHARRMLDRTSIEQSVRALAEAAEILFLGFGASGIVAQDAQQKFPLFGVPCSAPADAHQQFIAASLAAPGTVVVAISNTGRTLSIIEAAATARRNGARVIGISGARSPLLEQCDIPIIVETLENTDFYTPSFSRLAQLVVVDILATAVVLQHDDAYIERLRVMKAGLTTMRTGGAAPAVGARDGTLPQGAVDGGR